MSNNTKNTNDIPLDLAARAHVFALYYPHASHIVQQHAVRDLFMLGDTQHAIDLIYRLTKVLRLGVGDYSILFDRQCHFLCSIVRVENKRQLILQIHTIEYNKQLYPQVTWLLPLLKREAFEEAIYVLTELGVQHIQPLITQKAHRSWGGEKELARCQRIMIAAAEQSKQFVIPTINTAVPFHAFFSDIVDNNAQTVSLRINQAIAQITGHQAIPIPNIHPDSTHQDSSSKDALLFFDQHGISMSDTLRVYRNNNISHIIACSGPEGDLTYKEKVMLKQCSFDFVQLTQTVLRAQQAVTVGLGILRSLLR